MAIETVIAGRYSQTYSAVDTGFTQNGYELQQESSAALVDQSDMYGDSVLDGVYRGGNAFLQFESRTWKAGSATPFWPWGALGVMATGAAPIGRLMSAVAAAMVLTAWPSTPAATVAGAIASLTASKAILAENSPARLLLDSRPRNVPIRLRMLPSETTGTITWFSTT